MATRSVFVGLAAACSPVPEATADPGAPLPGLPAEALRDFAQGRALFDRPFTPADGLGPLFNQDRCSSCHDLPTVGGHGAEVVRKATRFEDGRCNLLTESGGDMIQQQATPLLRAAGIASEPIPRAATGLALIVPTSLYGLGLIEAIDSADIAAGADPDDRDRDGISGRLGLTPDGRLGRFGRKANFATIRTFVEDALANEMGLTTAARPHELQPAGRPLPSGTDPAPDPEIDEATVALLTQYVRLLAAPPRRAGVMADSVARGERLFHRIGCADCHTPSFTIDADRVAAEYGTGGLGLRRVFLYSDLLVHDLGDELSTICSANAGPSEWRTAPLMGLRLRQEFMHDGRARTLPSAINAHGGEASRSRNLYLRLSSQDQSLLIRFLTTL